MAEKSLARWNRLLFFMGLLKIPMLRFVRPKLLQLDDNAAIVRIRLTRRSRNHLNSMYFGALAVGADTAAGILAFYHSEKLGRKPVFAFKSMEAHFLSRPTSHVRFICHEGKAVEMAIRESIETGERVNRKINVSAFNNQDEAVAAFVMEVSVKFR